jgi:hypothetical protein
MKTDKKEIHYNEKDLLFLGLAILVIILSLIDIYWLLQRIIYFY